jgi:hypothetical protein
MRRLQHPAKPPAPRVLQRAQARPADPPVLVRALGRALQLEQGRGLRQAQVPLPVRVRQQVSARRLPRALPLVASP